MEASEPTHLFGAGPLTGKYLLIRLCFSGSMDSVYEENEADCTPAVLRLPALPVCSGLAG